MNPLVTQIASGFAWVIYGSFFEWYWHRYWMHTPRFPKEAFHGHTVVHHGIYKGDDRFFLAEGDHPEHILLKPYALPGIVLTHLPVMWAIDRFLAPNTFWGALIATVLYFFVYEYMHWNMHVPRGHFVERFGWFQFLRKHHHLHHRYYQKNFCVLFPLADWVFRTLITEESLARIKAEREEAIANGRPAETARPTRKNRKRRRQGRVSLARLTRMSPLMYEFARFRRSHARKNRKMRQLPKMRELLNIGSHRRHDD